MYRLSRWSRRFTFEARNKELRNSGDEGADRDLLDISVLQYFHSVVSTAARFNRRPTA